MSKKKHAMNSTKPAGERQSNYAPALAYPRPMFLITQLQLEMMRHIERDMKATGITPAVARVLNAIATRPQISSSAMARIFGIAPQSIKQSIELLEEKGLITRTASESDLRVQGAVLTKKGWKVREQHQQALAAMYRDVFGEITPREMRELTRILIKLLATAQPTALEYYADLTDALSKRDIATAE